MKLKYLIDTNVISEPLRPKPSRGVLRRLRRHEGEIAIPVIVWHELIFGCRRLPKSSKRTAIERYLEDVILESVPIIPYDRAAAEWHAHERARLVAGGRTPPFIDGQIAAIAQVNDLILITMNKTDFRAYRRLRIETWG